MLATLATTGLALAVTTTGRAPSPSAAGSGPGGAAPDPGPFQDVPADAPGAEAMRWAEETGVLPADEDGTFAPDQVLTRGAFASALHRYAGTPELPLDAAPTLFTDLGEDVEQASALLWLHGLGALWGDRDLRARPADDITATEAAVTLTALLRPSLTGVGAVWELPAPSADEEDGGEDAEATGWLAAAGLLPGSLGASSTGSSGEDQGSVTRGELAQILHQVDAVVAAAVA